MKFKVGDRVVVVRLNSDAMLTVYEEYLGTAQTITHIFNGAPYPYGVEHKQEVSFAESELEFEHIYNSPLYKALE